MYIVRSLKTATIILMTSFVGLAQDTQQSPQIMDHIHKFSFGDKKENALDVPEKKLAAARRPVAKSVRPNSATAPAVSQRRVEQLAREAGLMAKSAINPDLVFVNDDIKHWYQQNLDEDRLYFEFAARRIILDEADEQKVVIATKKIFADIVKQVIPLINKPPVMDSIICKGDTSEELARHAWAALEANDLEKVIACSNVAIRKWTTQADSQQLKAASASCSETPKPSELKSYFESNWALSDIATLWFIRGQAFRQKAKWNEAREAYSVVVNKYQCAFAWDSRGWFWRTADGAKEKMEEIRLQ